MVPTEDQVDNCSSKIQVRWGRRGTTPIAGTKDITRRCWLNSILTFQVNWSTSCNLKTETPSTIGVDEEEWSLSRVAPILAGMLVVRGLERAGNNSVWIIFLVGLLSMYFQLTGAFYLNFFEKLNVKLAKK